MTFENKLREVQEKLIKEDISGWLLYDYRHSNSLAYHFLEIPLDKKVTRRFFYWIPQKGEPIKILPSIEPYTLDHLPGLNWIYKGWQDLEKFLFSIAAKNSKIAMEYSPYNALPNVSKVDAGTVEFIQKGGAQVVSSANILQSFTSVLNPDQLQSHLYAAKVLDSIADRTWSFIEKSLSQRSLIDEYKVQQFMLQAMQEADCQTEDPPTCAVNANSANPHYYPKSSSALLISPGDFILIDLWCKKKQSHAVYADITRVGVAAPQATQRQKEIFNIVKKAQNAATEMVKEYYENYQALQGWQVDQACRNVIQEAGLGEYFIHRTGHNIGEEVHGSGANLDNFETHDYRQLLAGTCFSIEPGIYLPNEFGVRLEYDIYLDSEGQIRVTGGIQEELVCMQVY